MRSLSPQNRYNQGIPTSLTLAIQAQEYIAIHKDLESISEKIYKGAKIVIDDSSDYYFGQKEYEVRYALRMLYYNKCAYCETKAYQPDVEHYRPKKKVIGFQNNNHGYYWLCYEWTNLIPACYECNSRKGKGNKFPINNQRVTTPTFLDKEGLDFNACKINSPVWQIEGTLLLHPEMDNVEIYFKLLWNGKLKGLDGNNGKGNTTIKTCDLNRGNLIYARKAIINTITQNIMDIFFMYRNGIIASNKLEEALRIVIEDIVLKSDIKQSHSFVSWYIRNNFIDFVEKCLRPISKLEKKVLLKTFNENQ